ncbi:MAG TPA: translation elongation factor Ts [Candidatus Saccharimonadales bacterium]|nr:translation elongation factor Ts [Candidatus Saccharimonadales bacterium]
MSQAITADLVRQLREQTGAGIMDCKEALVEADGDFERARDILRAKGLASAQKRAGRRATEGLVDSYIHPGGRIGVLLEVNCETDFVARTEQFQGLVHDLALQIAGTSPRWIRREDVPEPELARERAIYREQALNEGKSEERLDQIVDGRLRKFYEAFCLYEQAWLRDEGSKGRKVSEVIQEVISATRENITVSRFVRFELGESVSGEALSDDS